MEELKSFELDVRIDGITRDQADVLLTIIKILVESWNALMAGGVVEVADDEEA